MAEAVRRVHTNAVLYFRGRTENDNNEIRCIIKTRWNHVSFNNYIQDVPGGIVNTLGGSMDYHLKYLLFLLEHPVV